VDSLLKRVWLIPDWGPIIKGVEVPVQLLCTERGGVGSRGTPEVVDNCIQEPYHNHPNEP
jgi:hypothetical protein